MEILQTDIGKVYARVVGKTEDSRAVYAIPSVPYARGERFEYAKLFAKMNTHQKKLLTEKKHYAFHRENTLYF